MKTGKGNVMLKKIISLVFASVSIAANSNASVISDDQMAEIRGGLTVTNILEPQFDAAGRYSADIDNVLVRFTLETAWNPSPVTVQLHSGSTKTGYQNVTTYASNPNPNLRNGAFRARQINFPPGTSYKGFRIKAVEPGTNNLGDAGEAGQPNNTQRTRKMRYNGNLVINKVWFHYLTEPDGDTSNGSISALQAQYLVDNPTQYWNQTSQYTKSMDAYENRECSLANRTNFRFHKIDNINVNYDSMATLVSPSHTWGTRFRSLLNNLSKDYYHVFIVDDITGAAAFTSYYYNYAVINASVALDWLAGGLIHEWGHSVGYTHVDEFVPGYITLSQYNNCSNPGNSKNFMCGNTHGVQIEPVQCQKMQTGIYRNGVRYVKDFNN